MKKLEYFSNLTGEFGTNFLVAMLSLNVFWTSTIALFGITIGFAMILLSLLGTVIVLVSRRKGIDRRWEKAMREAFATLFGRLALAVLVAFIAALVALTIQGLSAVGAWHAILLLFSLVFVTYMRFRLK